MTTAKMASKRVVARYLRKRKAHRVLPYAEQLRTARLQQVLRVREVKSQMAPLEGMIDEFREEMIANHMIFVQLGCDEGLFEESTVYNLRIDELDNDIQDLIYNVGRRITLLRRSEEISVKQGFRLEKRLQRHQIRYTGCGMYCTSL